MQMIDKNQIDKSEKTGHITLSFLCFAFLLFLFSFLLISCKDDKDINKMVPYDGPIMEVNNVETLYSDSAQIRVRLTAPKQLVMENEDLKYPKGIYIEFYDEKGAISSTLRANSGVYNKTKNMHTVTGNVIIVDSVKAQTMNTEELNWEPAKKKIHTDKFVTIQTPKEILKGEGLTANQDFSDWRILKPTGVFPVPE